jgi:amino acid adenylation domain-containing protein/non-ribosomal peptide synthase protein (TIGR01720 family)
MSTQQNIAIIGLAGRFPKADNLDAFLRLLEAGQDAVEKVGASRLRDAGLPETPDHFQVHGQMNHVDAFDHEFFKISKGEAIDMDPHQRLLLEVVYHAIQSAGIPVDQLKNRNIGVFSADVTPEYHHLATVFRPTLVSGNIKAGVAGRIARIFGLRGVALNIDTTCSSGLVAAHTACNELLLGNIDEAIVCGANVSLFPNVLDPGVSFGIEAPDGKCKPFSDQANGIGNGEAVVAFLLKPLDKAVADGDVIHAVIRGSAVNQDAHLSASLTAPSAKAQTELLVKAWQKAGIKPNQLGFLEAHGTGTKLGDPIEIQGLRNAFETGNVGDVNCAVSSVKSNLGHTDKAAGLVGLAKAVLSLKHQRLFKTLHLDRKSSLLEIEGSGIHLISENLDWKSKDGHSRIAGVSAFGLSGTNCHMVVEEYVQQSYRTEEAKKQSHLFLFSASSKESLRNTLADISTVLSNDIELADLALSLAKARQHLSHRCALVASSREELQVAIAEYLKAEEKAQPFQPENMIAVFSDASTVSESNWDKVWNDKELAAELTSAGQSVSSSDALTKAFICQYADYRLLESQGITTRFFIGDGTGKLLVQLLKGSIALADALAQIQTVKPTAVDELVGRLDKFVDKQIASGNVLLFEYGAAGNLSKALAQVVANADRAKLVVREEATEDHLAQLRKLYEAGFGTTIWHTSVNFAAGNRIALPLYPFEKTRCWLPLNEIKLAEGYGRKEDVSEDAAPQVTAELKPNRSDLNAVTTSLRKIWEEVLQLDKFTNNDDFFDLGGHSLNGMQIMNRIKEVFDESLEFDVLWDVATVNELAEFLHRPHDATAEVDRQYEIAAVEKRADYPVSSGQKRLWLLSQYPGASVAYNMFGAVELTGPLNTAAFKQALIQLVNRHESLRTVFKTIAETGELRQRILPLDQSIIEIEVVAADAFVSSEEVSQKVARTFDLATGPLFRAALLEVAPDKYVLMFNMHHIISDGWSLNVIMHDLMHEYQVISLGIPARESLSIHYKDFAINFLQQLEVGELDEQRNYWKNQFSGELPVLEFPTTKRRPPLKTYGGALYQFEIAATETEALKAFCKEQRGTTFVGLMSVLKVLLYRYSGQEDLVVGSPIAGREAKVLESQVGFYVNTLALRTRLTTSADFKKCFEAVKETVSAGQQNQAYPFDLLIEDLNLNTDRSRTPLFDVMLVLQGSDVKLGTQQDDSGLQVNAIEDGAHTVAKFDLTFNFVEIDGILHASIEYNTGLFEATFIQQIAQHFTQLIPALTGAPTVPIQSIEYLTTAEVDELCAGHEDTVDYPLDQTVVECFEEQVKLHGNGVALCFEDRSLTYAELGGKVRQLSGFITANFGPKKNDIIGLSLERSEWMIITMLAILKSGAAYLPLDPSYPQDRLDYMEEDSQCAVVIDQAMLDEFNAAPEQFESHIPQYNISPDQLAYVIYTSGSTGKPKGVLLEHKGLMNHAFNIKNEFDAQPGEKILQFFNIGFDAAAEEIFTALSFGLTLVVRNDEEVDTKQLHQLMQAKEVDYAAMPTAFFYELVKQTAELDHVYQLKAVDIGGEKIDLGFVRKNEELIRAFTQRFFNVYGPTETTLTATRFDVFGCEDLSQFDSLPIGKPYANRSIIVLDTNNQLVPEGVIGEIGIAGVGLARGYHQRDDLTNEKFIQLPADPSIRIYRSGDLGRWRSDGQIEYCGRTDHQVKVRGFRVELGEIENALVKFDRVSEGAVQLQTLEGDRKELVAYFVPSGKVEISALRTYLKVELPEYMVPMYYMELDRIPFTANRKIDRKKLPLPVRSQLQDTIEFIALETTEETVLAQCWAELLKLDQVGRKHNFFELGGDSIKAIQLVSKLHKHSWQLTVAQILSFPELSDMATQLEPLTRLISQEKVLGTVPFSPVQHWLFQEDTAVHHFNQSVMLESNDRIDSRRTQEVLQAIVEHHDALRLKYELNDQQLVQSHAENAIIEPVAEHDLSELDNFEARISEHGSELQASFALGNAPLICAAVFHTKEKSFVLFVAHHLVIDGVSWRILLEDFKLGYEQRRNDEAVTLQLKTEAFKTWTDQSIVVAQSNTLLKELSYWTNVATTATNTLNLDHPTGTNLEQDLAVEQFSFGTKQSAKLFKRSQEKVSINTPEILLSAFGLALRSAMDIDRILINLEGHGRTHAQMDLDVNRTVGWFTAMYPFMLQTPTADQLLDGILVVKEDYNSIPNGGVGFGALRFLNEETKQVLAGRNTAQITFNYLGAFGNDQSEDSPFTMSGLARGTEFAPTRNRASLLDLNMVQYDGDLMCSLGYSKSQFDVETIRQVLNAFAEALEVTIETLENASELKTPSDFDHRIKTDALQKMQVEHQVEDFYPLSPLQEGMYYHWLRDQSSTAYCEQLSFKVDGSLDLNALTSSFNQLIERHEILRTNFTHSYDDRVLQLVSKAKNYSLQVSEIPTEYLGNVDQFIDMHNSAQRKKGYDLNGGQLIQIHVFKASDQAHYLVWNHHHILMDGWCMGILVQEFFGNYYSATRNVELVLPKAVPFKSYINWLETSNTEQAQSYWNHYLGGYDESVELPGRIIGDEKQRVSQVERKLVLSEELSTNLQQLSVAMQVTLNAIFQTLWGVLLCKANNTTDAVFGTVVSGRPSALSQVEKIVGLFINTIPVRVQFNEATTLEALITAVKQHFIESEEVQHVQLAEIQALVGTEQLIDHVLIFENYPVSEMLEEGEEQADLLRVSEVRTYEETNYDFSIDIIPGAALEVRFAFNSNVFDETIVGESINALDRLIEQCVEDPKQHVSRLSLLEEGDKFLSEEEVELFSKKHKGNLVEAFEQQAIATPNDTAVIYEQHALTYAEINALANQFAQMLRADFDIKSEDLVALQLTKNESLMIAVLGTLKAGAAFVPIDPTYPQERIEYLKSDSACKLVIDDQFLQELSGKTATFPSGNLDLGIASSDLAYMIYTSGSTGLPKGVLVEHGNVMSIAEAWTAEYGLRDFKPRTLQLAAISFDVFVGDFCRTLLTGGCLVICPTETKLIPASLVSLLINNQINIFEVTPGLLMPILSYLQDRGLKLPDMKMVVVGSDLVTATDFSRIGEYFGESVRVINSYGTTETAIDSSYYELDVDAAKTLGKTPIGKAFGNAKLSVLDHAGFMQPAGMLGEISISGPGVARGYHNRAELTAARFYKQQGVATYRTGDLGYFNSDGALCFIGRIDDQVKIRGYRIELGEVQHQLQQVAGVKQALVIATTLNNEATMVGYLVGVEQDDVAEIKAELFDLLPSYMIPQYLVSVQQIPLTANGKVDKRALPSIDEIVTDTKQLTRPENELEAQLCGIWGEILGLDAVSTTANFFALGGHSLKVMYMMARIEKEMGVTVELDKIFMQPTIVSLSKEIKRQQWIHTSIENALEGAETVTI